MVVRRLKNVVSKFLLPGLMLLSTSACVAEGDPQPYADRAEVKAFIAEMVAEGFDEDELQRAFADASYKQSIIDAISRPAERVLTWDSYQDIFLTDTRVEKGQQFIAEHKQAFAAAEAKYGVPAEVIAAIIGVETLYGKIKGNYRVIDSLSTLAFDYPPRSKFFRSELKQFFTLVKEENQSPLAPMGSYAGAMGYGQFISSSYRHYAVDFDQDGVRDIWNNPTDAIGSVANYLAEHGWQAGQDVVLRAQLASPVDDELFNRGLAPDTRVASLTALGVTTAKSLPADLIVTPTLLNGKEGKEYWLGLQNFYVITRYNHSKLYAMAVFQLSERIKKGLTS